MIAVIDYGAGNVFNVLKACQYLGQKAELTADPQKISQADVVLFPGVGAFGAAMTRLKETGLDQVIKSTVANGTPFLVFAWACSSCLTRQPNLAVQPAWA